MSTSSYLLRIEGVNLASFVFDTRDLSTTRGGSLMLLNAVRAAKLKLECLIGRSNVRVLSQGASSGLFAIEITDPVTVAASVRDALRDGYKYCTFVVDVVANSGEFRRDIEALYAANRWRQMQASSLAVPRRITQGSMAKPACALDGIRPAVRDNNHGAPNRGQDKESFISDAVLARRNYGQNAKQRFYVRILGRVAKRETDLEKKGKITSVALPSFAKDFETIATQNGNPLDGKLAVFYADGNHFGKKQTEHCTDSERQIAFDEFLRFRRESFLTDFILTEISNIEKREWRTTALEKETEVEIRFETLLWGG